MDIEQIWLDLLSKASPLPDGTVVPVKIESNDPESQRIIPSISVHRYKVIPDVRHHGSPTLVKGYLRDSEGNPVSEIEEYRENRWLIQYKIGCVSGNPLHDVYLQNSIMQILGTQVNMFLPSIDGKSKLEVWGFQELDWGFGSRALFEDKTASQKASDQKLYERYWMWAMHVPFPVEQVKVNPIPDSVVWSGSALTSGASELDKTITLTKESSGSPNEVEFSDGVFSEVSD